MFCIDETLISSQLYKKTFNDIFTATQTSPSCFPSRNTTKNADIHPLPMRDVIIEQPHRQSIRADGLVSWHLKKYIYISPKAG